MQIRTGNMFDYKNNCDLLLVTGNSYIKKDSSLAMGRGAAGGLKNLYPGIEYEFGKNITHLVTYGLVIVEYKQKLFGLFQTKVHFKDKSTTDLIEYSTEKLNDYLKDTRATYCAYLNLPGVGYGGLYYSDVLPIIRKLTGKVIVWRQ